MVQLQADHPGLKWILPKDGGMIWTDNMLIPKGGNAYAASVLMNWYYRPEIAAEVEDYVNYICPVVGADKVLEKKDPAVAKNPLDLPDEGDARERAPDRREGRQQRRSTRRSSRT